MSRRTKAQQSSLELLLDTICNTFGGILFLAILVSMMLRMSSAMNVPVIPTEVYREQVLTATEQQTRALMRLGSLRQAAAEQEKTAVRFAPPDLAKLLTEHRERKTKRETLSNERAGTLSNTAESQARISGLIAKNQELDKALAAAEKSAREAEAALNSELEARSQTARLPRIRFTSKSEVGLIVRYGKVYFWHRYDASGNRAGLNTEDFVVVQDHGDRVETAPKPYAGLSLRASDDRNRLAGRLRQFDCHSQYLALVVWDDSFDVFQELKKVVVDLGFEYRLMPTTSGETIVDRGGFGRYVQ